MEEVLFHHDDPQSDTDSVVQSSTSPSTSHTLPSQPPIIFTTTEGQSINLSEVIKHTIASPDFVDCIGPLIANVVKASVDSALSNYVSNLEAKIEKQEQIISDLMVKNSELKESNKQMDGRVESIEIDLEELQQYGRRNSLRFHNVPLKKTELGSTDDKIVGLCKSLLGVNITVDDIDRSHIIGSINKYGNAQLICRFRNWKIKNSIFQQKRKLKNNPDKTVITEDLTQYRQYLMKKLNDARKRHEIDSFWTMDGRIFAKKTPEATKKFIGGMEDLSDLNVDLFTEHNHVLNDLMNIFCLQNVVKEATRFDHRSGRATLLDPILISEDCCATFTEVIDINRQMSDHNATKNFDWQTSLTAFEDDVDGMAVFFTEKYIEMAKNSIPTKTVTIRSSDKPWFNSEIRKEIRLRDRLHKKLRKLRTVQNTNKFKVQRNKVNNMITYAKEQFYLNANGLLDEKSNKNPKAFWSLVKKVMGNCRSTSIPPLLNPNTNEISVGEKEKADLLNSYFCNISTPSDDGVTPPDLPLRTQHSLDIDEITEDEIKDILKSLEIGKASGEDCISHQMLKYTANSSKANMTGTQFIPLMMLTYAVLPKPVQVRSTGYSNTCPAEYLPSAKDSNSCSIYIADTASLTNFLKKKRIWQDGYVQHARISIVIVGNVTDKTAPAPKDWLISYIDPSGPFYYVSWRSDFKVLSFGLLDDKPNQKVDIEIIENSSNNCTIQRTNKEITSQVVEYLTKEIRKANVTDNNQDYENIDLCFLTRFAWFIESPWYILKKYFGVPFQEFGYRCCNYFNGTVCCDDKLKEMEGYRVVPYIISVVIFCYIPLLIVRIGNLFTVFHPRHWYVSDQMDDLNDKADQTDEPNDKADQTDDPNDKADQTDDPKDKAHQTYDPNDKAVQTDDPNDKAVQTDDPNDKAVQKVDPNDKKAVQTEYVSMFGNVFFSEASTQKSELMKRKFRVVFILFLPTAIYIELCIYASAYEWKTHIQDIVEDGMLFGFTSMLGDPFDTSFLSPLGGPLGALLIYHVFGVLFLILPRDFEKDIIEKGTCHCITGFICKIAPQGCDLEGYKKFERVLKTGIYLWFNEHFWTNRRENKENDEKSRRENREKSSNSGSNEKICLNVWCNYNSNQPKSCSFLSTFGKRMFKDTLKFYKDIFNLTLQECEANFKTHTREDDNYVVYLEKEVARFVQKKVRPFYVEFGQMFFKAVIVILAYSAALIFLTNYSLAISDVLQNMTALVTSALPSIIQAQLKPELPDKRVIKYMVKCYENEEKKKEIKKFIEQM
ncbi:unnamed protein product [Mytilus coruscus]|uniref:Uncharacterized protein n=1 Tax=Mytilus coruscus TaxID=42192 RepID=A0A6J8ALD4_MYTCO|nr:unnamed protein product [Mytilus coruscus]